MYRHNIARFNYTTYDVRRSQDNINPNTSHRDIILLADNDSDDGNDSSETGHRFLYARVLGIYHVNAIFTGTAATRDYSPKKLHFLWVRWFSYNEEKPLAWQDCRLDPLHFPPVESDDAFGFVDPSDVLRGCHIIQAFANGKVHLDGRGISPCATDMHDWRKYYVMRYEICWISNYHSSPILLRFVDRDMVMRYHWGLAVGHLYTHSDTRNNSSLPTTDASAGHGDAAPGLLLPNVEMVDATAGAHANDFYAEDSNSHDADEFLLRNREDDRWEDMEGSDHDHNHDDRIDSEDVGDSDDEAALMMMDML
jgi:hypothetical protein